MQTVEKKEEKLATEALPAWMKQMLSERMDRCAEDWAELKDIDRTESTESQTKIERKS